MRRALLAVAAVLCASGAVLGFAAPATPAQDGSATASAPSPALVGRGRTLFAQSCSSCHGFDARGIPKRGPSLRGVGALAADFYLRTGRMPLAQPDRAPRRERVLLRDREIRALVAYVDSLGPGPGIPAPRPEEGSLAEGQQAFTQNCAGCHQVIAQGGVVTGARVPPLQSPTATQIAEAVRIGPYLMPRFPRSQISDRQLNSIVRYVLLTREPVDRGGLAIGNLGPFPEGIVAWLLGGGLLVFVCALIGSRAGS